MLNSLSQVLNGVGKRSETFALPDGSRLLLLPYGARNMGLFPPGSEKNFFWTNPALETAESAGRLFAGAGWHNTGGDRTWIAPEWDVFFPNATSTDYWQPRQLDMSDYDLQPSRGGIQMSRTFSLHLARSGRDANLRLTKWYGPAANPIRHERELANISAQIEYAGYTQRTTLESLDAADQPPPAVGIWNLIQLPPGGEMLVPLYARVAPQKCFGEMPAESMTIDDRMFRLKINFSGSHKIALKAVSLCGRAAYAYQDAGVWSLVIRNLQINPSGEYIDVQRHDPEDFGYAFQICRVDEPEFGSFCELEYHAPALGAIPEPARSEDVSQVWAFRGPREAIGAIAKTLLGAQL